MKKNRKNSKFCAVPDSDKSELLKEKDWSWVPRLQIVAGFIVVSSLISYSTATDGWKRYLSSIVAIGILLLFVSALQKRISAYKAIQNQRMDNLARQMTAFICDSALGRVERNDLKRLSRSAGPQFGKLDFSDDDFSLISRAWYFWKDGNGFEWQANTKCLNCGLPRIEHSQDGSCPEG